MAASNRRAPSRRPRLPRETTRGAVNFAHFPPDESPELAGILEGKNQGGPGESSRISPGPFSRHAPSRRPRLPPGSRLVRISATPHTANSAESAGSLERKTKTPRYGIDQFPHWSGFSPTVRTPDNKPCKRRVFHRQGGPCRVRENKKNRQGNGSVSLPGVSEAANSGIRPR